MFNVTTLSSKGQVVIPQNIREALRWRKGVILKVTLRKGLIVLQPVKK